MKMLLAVAVLALVGRTAVAVEEWGTFAIISDTIGVTADRLCMGEATRGELGCPSYAPFLSSTTENLGIGTTNPSVTLTVSGSTFSSDLILKSVAGDAPVSNTVSGGGGGASALNDLTDVTLSGSTTGDLLYYNGSAWINQASSGLFSADRITSGTLAVTANSESSIVSLSTAGTTWGYLGSAGSYLPRLNTPVVSSTLVSASTISTTMVQVISPTASATCSSSTAGALQYNATGNYIEMCNGTSWQPMGIGVPEGTISAFASTTCPTGWSEYTAARGRFLRGIDNSAGNDPDGTRSPGATQADAFQGHTHLYNIDPYSTNAPAPDASYPPYQTVALNTAATTRELGAPTAYGANGTPRTATETRPVNVAVTYCQFNGTSNGWNNPLSGGSTTPGGSTGQIQYNTSGSFDASAGLTWDNGSGLLTATSISTTGVSVTGIVSATYFEGDGSRLTGISTGDGDRITSGTTYVLASENSSVTIRTGGTDRA
ncbi:MAG: hypothetical protein COY40_03365 [Alphaproteobacteria bacterium CG_4_10_14_0_8_um_filter_53_9]|nr:MAG: hypothetical protein COY40_03365 [Alphaproteobacteria bacterium CG_4_10_14_0_8_um_filter_53_9]